MEFLKAVLEPEALAMMVPPVMDLIEKFGLETALAFDIGRPKLRLDMRVRFFLDSSRPRALTPIPRSKTRETRGRRRKTRPSGRRQSLPGWLERRQREQGTPGLRPLPTI